ncbi:hypothetical protein TNCV_1173081 [Trichonephila clavipes]|uniref:Uncharacterized protein n=1 Tax=Trichonephila clavipes TaxID=2585209 RepID=A0A8X6VEQ5_TRICX|nr:hypothetical protein TNCV_1173081 [Trichonephila clavipes]
MARPVGREAHTYVNKRDETLILHSERPTSYAAYGDETLSHAHVFEWYKRFSGGKDSVEDDEPAGRAREKRPQLGREIIRIVILLWLSRTRRGPHYGRGRRPGPGWPMTWLQVWTGID